ncbi:uncharacterized protein LOC128559062 [Mercenaria mercenaria]|uniref:uncharacterized protein LOC128559062 n=1 Tax=Mercenaria mercenaria TaxID=6596 RepID=UPI00234E9857|nr:uncharacterized protein LOC128559062 [Mercenaria mercenaria]
MSLKGHCPSDVGVVLHQCSEYNILSIVSRTHIKRFGYVYPPQLSFNQFSEWITSIYLPKYVSSFSSNQEHDCLGNKENKTFVMLLKPSQPPQEERRGSACVVSYSLFGSDKRYTDGALENAKLMKTIYPGWTMWVYHDSSVPPLLIHKLCEQNHVRCIDMTGSKISNKMAWRFLVTRSHHVEKYLVRDIDSRLSMREKIAVNEWIVSGKRFHVMRDHPSHKYLISGGMWGGTEGSLSDLYVKLLKENPQSKYKSDMNFLDRVAWPILKTSVLQHDSYYCDKYTGKPFLTPRNGWEHVGSVFINNRSINIDIELMKRYKPPKACQSDISIWEHL